MNPYSKPSSNIEGSQGEIPTGTGKAIASLILGIFGLLFWLLPIFGLPITIIGLVLGVKARNGANKGMATAGVIMCIIGLVFSSANAAYGAYLGVTGKHRLINAIRDN